MTPHFGAGTPQNFGPRLGTAYMANTNTGNAVRVWVPNVANGPDDRYFCHGRTLGTFNTFGYSVFSGTDVLRALRDEHAVVGNQLDNLQAGDIISWLDANQLVIHTASVVNAQGVPKTENNLIVWTKNGFTAEGVVSLKSVCGVYGVNYLFWR